MPQPVHPVRFTVRTVIQIPPAEAFALLCDWEDHSRWVPLTKVVSHSSTSFTAYTGIGPLQLPDNMELLERDDESLSALVLKTGPILIGTAAFHVRRFSDEGCVVEWREELTVKGVPRLITKAVAPVLSTVAKRFFTRALKRMAPAAPASA
jgi:carbon monoxide dehydrogenase subunit G